MKYLCLIYSEQVQWTQMPKAETDKVSAEYFAYTQAIKKSGHYLGGNALQPTQAATTVRMRNGKLSTTRERQSASGDYCSISCLTQRSSGCWRSCSCTMRDGPRDPLRGANSCFSASRIERAGIGARSRKDPHWSSARWR